MGILKLFPNTPALAQVLATVARATPGANSLAGKAPSIFPKEYLVHYWNEQITNNLPKPPILFSKASPLTAASATIFAEFVAKGAISDHLLSFCEEAQLLCFMNSSSDGVAATDDKNKVYQKSYCRPDTIVATDDMKVNGGVEQGEFFRESMLKSGNVLPMPDIRDNLAKMSFLPRCISSELPFSTSKLTEQKQIFHAIENSAMGKILAQTLGECEGAALQEETKRCVASIEDMIDFATLVLGHDVMVRSTESARGSKQEVLIGVVKRIEGSEGSKPVACHQSLFPYIVYYCHAFPNVRVYEADILDPKSKAKINHGVAICHMDTSTWSPTHESFLLLGSGPGQIEVCHWIYENSLIWTIAKS
ncbi:hypothetical protein ACJRO7_012545 [Eucalyptus globulus]|uniref:BURP domain-containing protein n=1 Tax=Eucalyptus globulus TaxID=34317 RepID=A0ABD3LIX9_EUCGL